MRTTQTPGEGLLVPHRVDRRPLEVGLPLTAPLGVFSLGSLGTLYIQRFPFTISEAVSTALP